MKSTFPLLVFLLCSLSVLAQPALPPPDWKDFDPLMGEWLADPSAPGDAARGGFVVESALAGRVLVRKNWAEYAPTKDRPAFRHDDLMVLFKSGAETRADYYDNEGHVIRYSVTVPSPGTFVFLSDTREGQPRFRLTQSIDTTGIMSIRFEIAPPNAPSEFKRYITASAHRKR